MHSAHRAQGRAGRISHRGSCSSPDLAPCGERTSDGGGEDPAWCINGCKEALGAEAARQAEEE
eukprot:13673032-Alexandrium_andersonii.AAC.1